ncbi:MAG: ImmA/IrrE family metallo-endopeptidase [Acidobacteriota bacterium]
MTGEKAAIDVNGAELSFSVVEQHVRRGDYGEYLDVQRLCDELGVVVIPSAAWEHETYHKTATSGSRRPKDSEELHSLYHPAFNGSPTIFVHESLSSDERRFFIVHELFHHLDVRDYRHRRGRYSVAFPPVAERRADTFALQLLVPAAQVVPALSQGTVLELHSRFRLHPPDLCSILLTRMALRDAFYVPTILAVGGDLLTSPRVKLGADMSEHRQVRNGRIAGPLFEITPATGRYRRATPDKEIWGGIVDASGSLYPAIGWTQFLTSWGTQGGVDKRATCALRPEPVIGESVHGYKVRAPKLGTVWTVEDRTRFAEMYVGFSIRSSHSNEPEVPYVVCFGLRDDDGGVARRWREGKLTLEDQTRTSTESVDAYVTRLRELVGLVPASARHS